MSFLSKTPKRVKCEWTKSISGVYSLKKFKHFANHGVSRRARGSFYVYATTPGSWFRGRGDVVSLTRPESRRPICHPRLCPLSVRERDAVNRFDRVLVAFHVPRLKPEKRTAFSLPAPYRRHTQRARIRTILEASSNRTRHSRA